MNKKEIQKLITKDGIKIKLKDFNWDENTNTISTNLDGYIFDFNDIDNINFITGSNCTFNTRYNCTFNTGSNCTFKTGWSCTFETGSNCTFKTGSYCTFKTGSNCTFKTVSDCTFETGWNCTFKTGWNCTFNTGSYCTFNTGYNCTFETEERCVVIRKDIFEIIQLEKDIKYQLAPYNIKGYVSNGIYSVTGKLAIIVDGILSEVISKKGDVYKVKNYNEKEISYLIHKDGIYSHGKTIKKAKESLMYKIGSRDKSVYKDLTMDSILTLEEAIKMYRVITGACESGTKYFVNNLKQIPEKLSVKEIIHLTNDQYNHNLLTQFFNK